MKYIPHTAEDLRDMLDVVGVNSLDELYNEVPHKLKLLCELNIPQAQSEIEIRRQLERAAGQNRTLICFAGAGAYDHYTPSVIPYITSRSEFSTSYTPYQAEISQGTLQYIFEYQTLMADLTSMDISNASMYDGATATAEAMLMCVAASKKRNQVLISSTFHPATLKVVETYAHFHNVQLGLIPSHQGVSDYDFLKHKLETEAIAGVILAQPNYYGIVEDFSGIANLCHTHKALLVINSVASSLSILRSPGEWGADIACGDAQSLGLPLAYGGPYIGYLCVKKKLIRKMPGRLVGQTTDVNGQRAFVLTMQAREQHIRREKATSNICTAQGMMCLCVAIYLSLMGPQGLYEVNEKSYAGAHRLHQLLTANTLFEDVFPNQPFLNEFVVRYRGSDGLKAWRNRMAQYGYLAGTPVEGMDSVVCLAVTEKRTDKEINDFVKKALS